MQKQQALERLSALEAEAAALRKIIEAPEVAGSLLTKNTRAGGFHFIAAAPSAGFMSYFIRTTAGDGCGNIFQTEEIADAYADALNTLLLLRHQPGTVPAEDIVGQWMVCPGRDAGVWYTLDAKMGRISPCFATSEDAQRAIDTIGADRILRMFRTLHHVGSDQ